MENLEHKCCANEQNNQILNILAHSIVIYCFSTGEKTNVKLLFKKAFKMIKNSIYFIVIALLVAISYSRF